MKFSGIGSQECDDLGMADIAEVEAVRSYAYSHGQFTVKLVSKLLQRLTAFRKLKSSVRITCGTQSYAALQQCDGTIFAAFRD